jgi:hypothetical protein
MKKNEKLAKEALRQHPGIAATDHVAIVTRKGVRMEYTEGQAVKQGFGSGGLFDVLRKKKK